MKEYTTVFIKRNLNGDCCKVFHKGQIIYETAEENYLVVETILNHMEQQRWNFVQMVGNQHLYEIILTFVR